MSTPLLFEPIELRGVTARNRIVVSPMCQYSARDGHVTDWHLVHLGKFAQGGAGIVFVEATAVEARGRITHGDTGICYDAHVSGLSRIAQFVRSQGAIPAIQLAHAGRKASMARPWYGNAPLTDADFARGDKPWEIVAPTAEPLGEGWLKPRPIGERDEEELLDAYRGAVRRAVAAGFQVPFAERVRKETGVKTMAVGLILTAEQAEEALAAGRADLVAIAREALYDPNWPHHAAQALGADPQMERWPVQYGWWLVRREGLLKKLGLRK